MKWQAFSRKGFRQTLMGKMPKDSFETKIVASMFSFYPGTMETRRELNFSQIFRISEKHVHYVSYQFLIPKRIGNMQSICSDYTRIRLTK